MIWREKRVLLMILGVLLAANTLFFFTYRVQYQQRLKSLEDRKSLSDAQLSAARSARTGAERRLAAYRQIQRDVQTVYAQHWATETERLTPLIAEVKRLAVASELVPRSTSYVREARKGPGLGTSAETVTITFTVQGNYQQVRRLISLLELSQQFVIIDQIGLTASDNQLLTLTLQLKTLFRDTSPLASKESCWTG